MRPFIHRFYKLTCMHCDIWCGGCVSEHTCVFSSSSFTWLYVQRVLMWQLDGFCSFVEFHRSVEHFKFRGRLIGWKFRRHTICTIPDKLSKRQRTSDLLLRYAIRFIRNSFWFSMSNIYSLGFKVRTSSDNFSADCYLPTHHSRSHSTLIHSHSFTRSLNRSNSLTPSLIHTRSSTQSLTSFTHIRSLAFVHSHSQPPI